MVAFLKSKSGRIAVLLLVLVGIAVAIIVPVAILRGRHRQSPDREPAAGNKDDRVDGTFDVAMVQQWDETQAEQAATRLQDHARLLQQAQSRQGAQAAARHLAMADPAALQALADKVQDAEQKQFVQNLVANQPQLQRLAAQQEPDSASDSGDSPDSDDADRADDGKRKGDDKDDWRQTVQALQLTITQDSHTTPATTSPTKIADNKANTDNQEPSRTKSARSTKTKVADTATSDTPSMQTPEETAAATLSTSDTPSSPSGPKDSKPKKSKKSKRNESTATPTSTTTTAPSPSPTHDDAHEREQATRVQLGAMLLDPPTELLNALKSAVPNNRGDNERVSILGDGREIGSEDEDTDPDRDGDDWRLRAKAGALLVVGIELAAAQAPSVVQRLLDPWVASTPAERSRVMQDAYMCQCLQSVYSCCQLLLMRHIILGHPNDADDVWVYAPIAAMLVPVMGHTDCPLSVVLDPQPLMAILANNFNAQMRAMPVDALLAQYQAAVSTALAPVYEQMRQDAWGPGDAATIAGRPHWGRRWLSNWDALAAGHPCLPSEPIERLPAYYALEHVFLFTSHWRNFDRPWRSVHRSVTRAFCPDDLPPAVILADWREHPAQVVDNDVPMEISWTFEDCGSSVQNDVAYRAKAAATLATGLELLRESVPALADHVQSALDTNVAQCRPPFYALLKSTTLFLLMQALRNDPTEQQRALDTAALLLLPMVAHEARGFEENNNATLQANLGIIRLTSGAHIRPLRFKLVRFLRLHRCPQAAAEAIVARYGQLAEAVYEQAVKWRNRLQLLLVQALDSSLSADREIVAKWTGHWNALGTLPDTMSAPLSLERRCLQHVLAWSTAAVVTYGDAQWVAVYAETAQAVASAPH
jgi:hypothetical protein